MQYRIDQKSGNKLSILGFGCMRFPGTINIDRKKSEALIKKAFDAGINYFDTAYIYPGNEEALGSIVNKLNIRKDIYIATKLPQTMCHKYEDFDKFLDKQLVRLQTDYIDYYLLHNISDYQQWVRLCDLGIIDWIEKKKKSGKIKQLGFSYHGSENDFLSLIDAYDWDFVQIQYNYININYQAGKKGLLYAAKNNIPVFIMEPLLGGKLVNNLPKNALDIMKKSRSDFTPVSWALNWLWNQKEVTVVLSGMNDMNQLEENIKLASIAKNNMLNVNDEEVINKVIKIFSDSYKIPCTGCNYCLPCPKNINIPGCFLAYNTRYSIGFKAGMMLYMNTVGIIGDTPRFASDCVKCGKCEKHCPQNIKIREELVKVSKRMEPTGIKTIGKIAKKVMNR